MISRAIRRGVLRGNGRAPRRRLANTVLGLCWLFFVRGRQFLGILGCCSGGDWKFQGLRAIAPGSAKSQASIQGCATPIAMGNSV